MHLGKMTIYCKVRASPPAAPKPAPNRFGGWEPKPAPPRRSPTATGSATASKRCPAAPAQPLGCRTPFGGRGTTGNARVSPRSTRQSLWQKVGGFGDCGLHGTGAGSNPQTAGGTAGQSPTVLPAALPDRLWGLPVEMP